MGIPPRFKLIYHWEAEDWVSGNWVDRVQGLAWTKTGTPTKVTRNNRTYLKLSYAHYFKMNLNSPGLILGNKFRIEVEFEISEESFSKSNFLFDFGSLNSASHAFSISISTSYKFGFNAKIVGNDSSPKYTPPQTNIPVVTANEPHTVVFGIEAYDTTKNITYCEYNGVKSFGSNTLTQQQSNFNKNFNTANGWVGRGEYNGSAYQTDIYKYIKSIKIFKDTRTL